MTSKYFIPTADLDGWVNSPIKVADYLVSHFFLSDYSQTMEFKGDVASFSWLLHSHQGDISRITSETKNTLADYFSKYFHDVKVEIVEKQEENSINNYGLMLYLEFTDNLGIIHTLSRLIKHNGMKVNDIIAVINGI